MGYNDEPLQFNTDEVLALIPGMSGARMNGNNIQVTCPFCGKQKYWIRRDNGLGHCMSATCPSNSGGSRGFNLWQLYGAVYGLSNGEAVKELKQRLGYNDPGAREKLPQRVVYQAPEPLPTADPGKLHAVYSALLEEFSLDDDHRQALKARGFSDITIESCMFKTYPSSEKKDFFSLCRRLMGRGLSLEGIPGFFTCKNGAWCLKSKKRGIVMPTRDYAGRIVGLQVRIDDELRLREDGTLGGKCSWLTSKDSINGAGAKTFVHFACDWIWDNQMMSYRPYFNPENVRFLLTEGMMKAELIHQFQPETVVLSVPGVDALYYLQEALHHLAGYGATTITLAYDMDYETNPNVFGAMEKTKKMIEDTGLKLWRSPKGTDHARWPIYAEVNGEKIPCLKGMDDYLAYKHLGIVPEIKKVV